MSASRRKHHAPAASRPRPGRKDVLRSSVDETKLSPAERRYVEDTVEEHRLDAVIRTTFGGGDPNRLLDFPPAR